MKIIQNNPYRIAGILSNVTARELQKQKTKIKAYTKVGKEIKSDYDFQILENIARTEDSVNKAFSYVEQNHDKVNYSLFWFLNTSPFDNTAIEYLKNGNKEKAVEIWEKVTIDKDVNSKNFSGFNNLGTLKLLSENKSDIKIGIESKIKLIESDYFENFVHSVADETFTIDNQKQSESFIDELLTQFKNKFPSSETLQLFSGCNGTTHSFISKKFTEEPIQKIESQIESCKKKRKNNNSSAYEYGLKLYADTKADLSLLKYLLDTNNLKYNAYADQLANEIMQCGIDYFNESNENDSSEDYLELAQKLTKLADSIAVGRLAKDRAKDSLSTLEEMKGRVVLQAIDLIQSVKDAYETNEVTIRRQVKELEETDIQIKLGYKTINHSAVEDNIRNSIDWSKVNDLIKEVLHDRNLEKIKSSPNSQHKTEFLKLANWLKKHSQNNSIIDRITEKYKKIPPKLSFKILSSEITNTDNKPIYTKYIRYIGLKLDLKVMEDTTVTFYLKYINPNGSIKRNSEISPIGYSQSVPKSLNKLSSTINLPGWGNADKCNYDIGEHRIEVYVDEYLIHTKKYNVDLAPSEKIEKEIACAENKLKKIQQTNYFETEINTAKNELYEIHKFQLFRGSSEKQRQIQSQQRIIDQLIAKSESEKKKNITMHEEKIYKLKMELSAQTY
ncbi:hypothetical protein [Labilibaculum euxinus]